MSKSFLIAVQNNRAPHTTKEKVGGAHPTQLRKRELSLKHRAKYFRVENGYLKKEISYNV